MREIPFPIAPGASNQPPSSLSDQLRHGNVMAAACPSRPVLRHLTSRWGVLVLIALRAGTLRFSQLRRQIEGVSERMLAQALRQLESDGIVSRRVFNTVPPQVDYTLTPLGREAADKVGTLVDWLEVNLPRLGLAQDSGAPAPDST